MSETMEAPAVEARTETGSASGGAAKTRRRSKLDAASQSVTITEPNGTPVGTFSAADLSPEMQKHFTLLGMWSHLRGQEDMKAAYAKLLEGRIPVREKAEKSKPVSDWRKAFALALVAETKNSDAPMTIEQATKEAMVLPREKLSSIKAISAVQKQYRKLTGQTAETSLTSLLAPAA